VTAKKNPWFRMYSDFMFDETFGLLSAADQRHFIFLLCVQHRGTLDKGYEKHMLSQMVASRLSLSLSELSELVSRLDALGLIDPATYQPSNAAIFTPDRPLAHVWRAIRERIFARDDYTCQYCGERGKKLECDHIHPVAKGGSHEDGNLTTACLACNRSKRDKTVSEWRAA
jgi:hypothetical protein